MAFGRKQSNKKPKDKLKTMKRFIMGDDVVESVLSDGIPRITGLIIWDGSEKIAEITKGAVIWHEQRTYDDYKPSKKRFPDSEIEGVSYDNPPTVDLNDISDSSDVSGHSDKIETEARNEPVMSSQALQARELKNRSKEYLADKLRQFAEQEKIDLEEREKFILWKRMNSSL